MKQDKPYISDAELQALLDEQLDAKERDRIFSAVNKDASVRERLAELRLMSDMLQHAYAQPPQPSRKRPHSMTSNSVRWGMAACFMLCLGLVIGWFIHTTEPFSSGVAGQVAVGKSRNVILHLNSADPQRVKATLDRAEAMLSAYRSRNERFKLEIIANDGGLNLMRTDVSTYQQRIQKLTDEYDNVTFLACAKAISHLQEKGIDVELLPDVEIAPSALEQIIQRLQDNWEYIRA